jgi:hypothetical protein
MQPTNFAEIETLTEKLDILQQKYPQHNDQNLKFERASQKLQTALQQFMAKPDDQAKMAALQNALNAYKTACGMFLIKMQLLFEEAKRAKADFNELPIFSDLSAALDPTDRH